MFSHFDNAASFSLRKFFVLDPFEWGERVLEIALKEMLFQQ